jgi:hypothetical protein
MKIKLRGLALVTGHGDFDHLGRRKSAANLGQAQPITAPTGTATDTACGPRSVDSAIIPNILSFSQVRKSRRPRPAQNELTTAVRRAAICRAIVYWW